MGLDPATVEEIRGLPWFHEIDFGNGIRSPGVIKSSKLRRVSRAVFDRSLAGKSVLDIGCWDGAQSVEAVRRGAARVLATDHYSWHGGWGNRRCFDLTRQYLAPGIEVMDIDVPDLSVESVGTFDVVLFLGVLYHLRHPLAVLERIAPIVKEVLVLETRIMNWPLSRPMMRFWPGSSLGGDHTNWWTPNIACVIAWLADLGFSRVKTYRPDWRFRRCIFHAER